MAFVFRSTRAELKSGTSESLGPGAYVDINKVTINPQIPKNLKPFNSTSVKGEQPGETKAKENLPGPGQYNIQQNQLEKVVISSPDEEIKVIEIPKPSPFFKDEQKRFVSEVKNLIPGPGSYCIEPARQRRNRTGANVIWRPKNVIEHLMQINRYSSIPSIPGKQHQFGYTENENNILELNQLNASLAEADKNRGPGSYNIPGVFEKKSRTRGISWHVQTANQEQSTQQQQIQENSKSFIGPGSYDIQNNQQSALYRMKQSAAFASRSSRDPRRGERTNSFLSQKTKEIREAQGTDGSFLNDLEPQDESDSEFEFIEDATPGPGYYHNESTMTSIKTSGKPEKFQYFGSRQERFKVAKSSGGGQIGPGHYTPNNPLAIVKEQSNSHVAGKTVPFGSSDTRFEMRIFQEIKPSPGQYDPRNAFEDRLIYRIQKGYRGNFGSTERRFANPNAKEEIPGPGSYLDPIAEKDIEEIKPSAQFISKTKRDFAVQKKKVSPAPGSYNIDIFDINKKAQIDEEDDPLLAVKKPGFLSGQPRFKELKNIKKKGEEYDDEDDIDIPTALHKQTNDMYKKKAKPPVPFGIKEGRFQTKQPVSKIAPGDYFDAMQGNWNKRTFNILFAEI